MPNGIDPREFGQLQAQVVALENLVLELRGDVKELVRAVESAKGGWKTLILLGGAGATLGAMLVKLLPVVK